MPVAAVKISWKLIYCYSFVQDKLWKFFWNQEISWKLASLSTNLLILILKQKIEIILIGWPMTLLDSVNKHTIHYFCFVTFNSHILWNIHIQILPDWLHRSHNLYTVLLWLRQVEYLWWYSAVTACTIVPVIVLVAAEYPKKYSKLTVAIGVLCCMRPT